MGILIKTNQTDLAYPATAIIPVFHYPTFETKGAHLKGGDLKTETTGGGNAPPPV